MKRLLLLCACALLAPLVTVAANAAEPLTLERLRAAGAGLTTLRVPFTQEKHLAILDEPVVTQGVLEISRPLQAVRWEFTGRSVLLFAHDHVRRFGAEGKEEAGGRDPGLQSMAGQMRALLSGDWTPMKELFDIAADADGTPRLVLTPRTPDLARYLSRLEIRFRADLSAPESILLVANGDDRTEYRFAPPQAGAAIPPARFEQP